MSNSTSVVHALTPPHCDTSCDRRLRGAAVSPLSLTRHERDEMYGLLEAYFDGTDRDRFELDLAEKDSVLVLRESQSGRIRGFSTSMRLATRVDGQDVVAFFSGDTIVAREHWGESLLSRLWAQTIFGRADRILAAAPQARVYWFLICSGFRTWRFLPVFFREFYPNPATPTPLRIQRTLRALGKMKFGDEYLEDLGVVRFRAAAPLRDGVGEVTERRLRDPYIAFFSGINPGHAAGDELACLTEVSRTNLTRAGERMVAAGAESVEL
jgi:hypothetical protein